MEWIPTALLLFVAAALAVVVWGVASVMGMVNTVAQPHASPHLSEEDLRLALEEMSGRS